MRSFVPTVAFVILAFCQFPLGVIAGPTLPGCGGYYPWQPHYGDVYKLGPFNECNAYHKKFFPKIELLPGRRMRYANVQFWYYDNGSGGKKFKFNDRVFAPSQPWGDECSVFASFDITNSLKLGNNLNFYEFEEPVSEDCTRIHEVRIGIVYYPGTYPTPSPVPTALPTTASPTTAPPTASPTTAPPTASPTTAPPTTASLPTSSPTTGGGDDPVKGDPHFRTWTREKYDFHGVCDLVLLHNPLFRKDLGMDIHIRTKKMRETFSYTSSAVLRIADDTLEVMGGDTETPYWINGVKGEENLENGMVLKDSVSTYPIIYNQFNENSREFVVDLDFGVFIHIKVYYSIVSISITGAKEEDFEMSTGLMGTYHHGVKMSRDNSTMIDDINAFGQEWQVLPTEPKLFHNVEGPQAPDQKCDIPSTSDMRRNLRESIISREDAEIACSGVHKEDEFDLCVFDVMATNDKNMAGAY